MTENTMFDGCLTIGSWLARHRAAGVLVRVGVEVTSLAAGMLAVKLAWNTFAVPLGASPVGWLGAFGVMLLASVLTMALRFDPDDVLAIKPSKEVRRGAEVCRHIGLTGGYLIVWAQVHLIVWICGSP